MIALSREQLDGLLVLEPGLAHRCDACGEAGEHYLQGECEGKLFSVALNPAKKAFVASDSDINIELCREHVRLYRGYITWGVSFCSCGGIIERTGLTKPVDTGDGVWEEARCEYFSSHEQSPVAARYKMFPHYQAWEVLD